MPKPPTTPAIEARGPLTPAEVVAKTGMTLGDVLLVLRPAGRR